MESLDMVVVVVRGGEKIERLPVAAMYEVGIHY